MHPLLSKLLLLILLTCELKACNTSNAGLPNYVSRTIIDNKNGSGNCTSVQQAIDSIPSKNLLWYIHVSKKQCRFISFYQCRFISFQDTLNDARGRHYFNDSYVEGAIDFIWGNGQSMYEKYCINSTTSRIGRAGYITAQGRESANETTGYVFKHCYVAGSGPIFLGRPYRNFSRVLFAGTYMEDVIKPEGWKIPSWSVGAENLITFLEANCSGPGANMTHRVKWEKQLSQQELLHLRNTTDFINQEGWIDDQPN